MLFNSVKTKEFCNEKFYYGGFAVDMYSNLFLVNHNAKNEAKKKVEKYDNYMTEGMCLGMMVGTTF